MCMQAENALACPSSCHTWLLNNAVSTKILLCSYVMGTHWEHDKYFHAEIRKKNTKFGSKIVSEYDQEIPQSQPRGTARKSRSTITRHQEDKLSKATSSLFPIKMIATLEQTQSSVQQNRTFTDSHNGSNHKQEVNNNRITALEQTAA